MMIEGLLAPLIWYAVNVDAPVPVGPPTYSRGDQRVFVEADGKGVERVLIQEMNGDSAWRMTSESWCHEGQQGTHHENVLFFESLQRAVAARDAKSAASLMRFPLQVYHKGETIRMKRKQFIVRFDRIFGKMTTRDILEAWPADVFCRRGSVSGGGNQYWAEKDDAGSLKIFLFFMSGNDRRP